MIDGYYVTPGELRERKMKEARSRRPMRQVQQSTGARVGVRQYHEGEVMFYLVFDRRGLRAENLDGETISIQGPSLKEFMHTLEGAMTNMLSWGHTIWTSDNDVNIGFTVHVDGSYSIPKVKASWNGQDSPCLNEGMLLEVMGEIGFSSEEVHRKIYEIAQKERMAHLLPAPPPLQEDPPELEVEEVVAEIIEPEIVDDIPPPAPPSGDQNITDAIVLREEDVEVKKHGITGLGLRKAFKKGASFARDVAVDVASRTIYNMMNGR